MPTARSTGASAADGTRQVAVFVCSPAATRQARTASTAVPTAAPPATRVGVEGAGGRVTVREDRAVPGTGTSSRRAGEAGTGRRSAQDAECGGQQRPGGLRREGES